MLKKSSPKRLPSIARRNGGGCVHDNNNRNFFPRQSAMRVDYLAVLFVQIQMRN